MRGQRMPILHGTDSLNVAVVRIYSELMRLRPVSRLILQQTMTQARLTGYRRETIEYHHQTRRLNYCKIHTNIADKNVNVILIMITVSA